MDKNKNNKNNKKFARPMEGGYVWYNHNKR